jgi:AraC-like DNA-binding protein
VAESWRCLSFPPLAPAAHARHPGRHERTNAARPPPTDQVSLGRVLLWLEESLHDPLSLEDIARRAAMSVRSLGRHFKEQTGATPLQWLLKARVRRAQGLLETTPLSVERVATSAGFGSVAAFRLHFRRVTGTSPQAYRWAFQGRATGERALSLNQENGDRSAARRRLDRQRALGQHASSHDSSRQYRTPSTAPAGAALATPGMPSMSGSMVLTA